MRQWRDNPARVAGCAGGSFWLECWVRAIGKINPASSEYMALMVDIRSQSGLISHCDLQLVTRLMLDHDVSMQRAFDCANFSRVFTFDTAMAALDLYEEGWYESIEAAFEDAISQNKAAMLHHG